MGIFVWDKEKRKFTSMTNEPLQRAHIREDVESYVMY